MAAQTFDLIVIGSGTAGAGSAKKCAKEDWEVAIIDDRPFGGTCALRGCDPKKVLVGAAAIIDQNRRMRGKGIQLDNGINWHDLMQFKRMFTEPVPEATVEDLGITVFHGEASFLDEQTLNINDQQIRGDKKILIASGNKPAPLPIDGFGHLTTSDAFLELEALPEKIVFVGGGYISFEFAHIAARAGAAVDILHQLDHPLKNFDTDMVQVLLKKSEEIGISTHLNTEVKAVEQTGSGFKIMAQRGSDTVTLSSDMVVHGAGRVPKIDALDLEKANIAYSKKGVKVNDYLQSVSNGLVYAAGDAADSNGLPLTPLAGFESNIVTSNLLEGNHKKVEYPVQPTTVFTVPPLASVGLTESRARGKGMDVKVNFQETDDWYSSRRTNESHTAFKTIINKETGEIAGAHILGDHSAELINFFALAMNQHINTGELKKMLYAYPTHGSDIPYMI